MADPPVAGPDLSALPELFGEIPEVFADDWDPEEPWALLGDPLTRALAAQPDARFETRISPDVHLAGSGIVIERGVSLAPGVVLEGPLYLGSDVVVRPGAYLRGGCWIGAGAVVGTNTEVKRSIFLPGARAPHLNYVGDSVLGRDVNLGAGTILSNFRHDGAVIRLPVGSVPRFTGRRKLGAILGDGVRTGCNCVLHPGCVVGRQTSLYPGVQLRSGVYAARSIVKLVQALEVVPVQPNPGVE